MYNNNSNGRGAASARGFMAFFAMLAKGLGMMARPAEAQPFAYVTNLGQASWPPHKPGLPLVKAHSCLRQAH